MSTITCGSGARAGIRYWQRKTEGDCLKSWLSVAGVYIMDTSPIVRRKDEKKYDGDYRTKRVILEIYDAMQEAIRTGHPYQTRLDPPQSIRAVLIRRGRRCGHDSIGPVGGGEGERRFAQAVQRRYRSTRLRRLPAG